VPVQGAALLDPSQPQPVPPRLRDTPLPGPMFALTPPGPVGGQIGTAHRMIVPDADPAGRWALVCQAREDTDGNGAISFGIGDHGLNEGDTAAQYLVRGSGAGERIEGLIARDPAGCWLVVARARGEIVLLDVERGMGTELFPSIESVRHELYPLAPATISFDSSGEHLLYRRRSKRRVLLVVRHLESGSEWVVDPGPGELIDASWYPGSAWLRIEVVREDLNGDHRIDVPRDQQSPWVGTCGLGSTTFMAGHSEDVSVESVAWATGLRISGKGHRPFGDELIVPEEGAFVAVAPSGTRRALQIESGCRPVFGDAIRGRVIADCGGDDETVLVAFDARRRTRIGRRSQYLYSTRVRSRVLELNILNGGHTWLSLDSLRIVDVHGDALAVHGSRVLIRGEHDVVLDLATGRQRRLRGPAYWWDVRGSGRYAYAGPWLVDLELGRSLARLATRVYAMTTDGRVLVDAGEQVVRWLPWQAAARNSG